MKRLSKIYRYLFLAFPAVLYFSYFPIIALGGNESMNFELSLPLIYLVVFDVLAVILMIAEKKYKELLKYKLWVLFPIWVAVSIIWSLNVTRGILTAGILWAILVAGISIISFRKTILKNTWPSLRKVIYVSGLVAIIWCVLQCVLDLAGVSRDVSLLCAGCTKEMFGFPHPSGFAIEPQFMGNLLLAPALLSARDLLIAACPSDTLRAAQAKSSRSVEHTAISRPLALATVFAFGVFLTFSRGAIFAFGLALIVAIVIRIVKDKNAKSLVLIPVVLFSFLLALNAQGLMSAFSGLGETYNSGINKVVNHLSLGVINLKSEKPAEKEENENKPVFDGYVAESTDTRVRLTNSAIEIWKKDFKNAMIGVGVGGAGQALYNNDLSPAPKEIVQNEYASVLLETGIIGLALFIFTIVLAVMAVIKIAGGEMILILMAAFGVTLFFFSGYPNALHIYLLPVMIGAVAQEKRPR